LGELEAEFELVLLGAGDASDVLNEAVEPRALAAERLPYL
jgi:hypothetical protein